MAPQSLRGVGSLSLIFVVTLGVVAATGANAAAEVRDSVGRTSFAVPAGFTVHHPVGAAQVVLKTVDGGRYCLVTIDDGRDAGAAGAADFAGYWSSLAGLGSTQPVPAKTTRIVGRHWVAEGGAQAMIDAKSVHVQLLMLFADGGIVRLAIYTPDVPTLRACQRAVDPMLVSVRIGLAAPLPLQAAAAATEKTTITLADLAGTWSIGSESIINFADAAAGKYADRKVSWYAKEYRVKADGTFTFRRIGAYFVSRGVGATSGDADSGTISLGDNLVIPGFKGRGTERMRRMGFVVDPDGTTTMTLVPDSYQTDPKVVRLNCEPDPIKGCVGGDSWVRKPARPK